MATLDFLVSRHSRYCCSVEWGLNSPLKQNMAIGAGVARAIETWAEVDQVSN